MSRIEELNTDLALERVPQSDSAKRINGADISVTTKNGCTVTDITVRSEPAISIIGKPAGRYITIEVDEQTKEDDIAVSLSEQILKLTGDNVASVLVAGLGNRDIPADSLGARCVDGICVTRLLSEYAGFVAGVNVSAVAPGVLGDTGMETAEILNGICSITQPETVIAIDSLCARDVHRIATTYQLTDTGISPGAGLGNNRRSLNEQTLGRRVIGIGVPTVVYARTVCHNVLEMLARKSVDYSQGAIDGVMSELDDELINSLVVTPKDIDTMCDTSARIISRAINIAFGGC